MGHCKSRIVFEVTQVHRVFVDKLTNTYVDMQNVLTSEFVWTHNETYHSAILE